MPLQERYDDAMFAFSQGDYDACIAVLQEILQAEPENFDAQLGLGMAWYRKGDYPAAIREGHKAESLRPHEQLVHTNLSLFYMKSGDKKTAEHHGLQARISSWRSDAPKQDSSPADPDLQMAPQAAKAPMRFPTAPWKKKPPENGDLKK